MTRGARRVGITQRQVVLADRGETRDALDVRLPRLIWSLGMVPVPLPTLTDRISDYLDDLALDGFVLSGGDDPGVTPERDRLEEAVLNLAEARRVPLVGVCRGMQQLVLRAGGSLRPVAGHAGTRHAVEGPAAGGRREVNSFHHHGVAPDALGGLTATAVASDGTVEAVSHPTLPWVGVMWHPEREDVPAAADVALLGRVLARGGAA